MRKIYAFDFDGTITNCDSLIAIIRYVSGSRRLLLWILSHLHLLLLMKAGLYSNNKLKQQLCRHIFAGMTEEYRIPVDRELIPLERTNEECEILLDESRSHMLEYLAWAEENWNIH